MLSSMVCRYDHFLTDWYREWAAVLPLAHYGIDPPPMPQRPHRKAWEWCAIAQALLERRCLNPVARDAASRWAPNRSPRHSPTAVSKY